MVNWADVSDGRAIVAMVPYRDMVIVATEFDLFSIRDGKVERLKFEYIDQMDAPTVQSSPNLDDEIPF